MPSNNPSPILRVTTALLNTVNDTVAGGSTASFTGTAPAPGQVGMAFEIDVNTPVVWDPTIGTLYPGTYQYVQTLTGSDAAPAKGEVAFWVDTNNYIVSPDATDGNQAGVYLNTVTRGNYCFIQTRGVASVLFAGSLNKATPAVKDLVVCSTAANTADVIDDATTVTGSILKRQLGIAEAPPVAGAISLVKLYELGALL